MKRAKPKRLSYFSVYISRGSDHLAAGALALETLRGRRADYTGGVNYFYVEKRYDKATLIRKATDIIGGEYSVTVKRINRENYLGG